MFIIVNRTLGFCSKASEPWIWSPRRDQAQHFATWDEAYQAKCRRKDPDNDTEIELSFDIKNGIPSIGFENRWKDLCNQHQVPPGMKKALEDFMLKLLPPHRGPV